MPKYQNRGGQPRDKAMVASYALVTKFGATQKAVAAVMGTTPSTIHNWVKEMGYKAEIEGLEKRLDSAHDYIESLAQEMNLIEYDEDEQPVEIE